MTKTRWRIYTEYVHSRHIAEIVNKYFSDYFMFTGIGYHCGEKERCLIIEIIANKRIRSWEDDKAHDDVIAICKEINTANHQTCCLVISEQVDVMTVTEKA